MPDSPDIKTETLAETENYMIYTAEEPDGETTWNVELGTATLHFFREEWQEFLDLVSQVKPKKYRPHGKPRDIQNRNPRPRAANCGVSLVLPCAFQPGHETMGITPRAIRAGADRHLARGGVSRAVFWPPTVTTR